MWQGEAMSSTLLEQYAHAIAEFGARVEQIRDDQWGEPTPCTDWDVRALLAHVVDEQRWAPYLLGGGTADAAGDRFADDPLGADPTAAWREASATAQTAFEAAGALDHPVSLSSGLVSARDYLWQMTTDAAVHAWDLARGIGADDQLDHELVRRVHTETEKDVEVLAKSGLYGDPVPVASGADLQTRMLGLFGRRA